MAKVSIIEVDLGMTVESIITADLCKLTDDNVNKIGTVVAAAQATQNVIAQRALQDDAKSLKLSAIYSELLKSKNDNATVSSQRLLALAAPEMDNMISIVGSMRNWLKANDPQHKMVAIKKGKSQSYCLEPADPLP